VLVLDTLATRYHLLPSEVLARSDTLDYFVMDVAISWHNSQQEEAQAKADGKPAQKKLSVDQMQEMINKVRKK
jgi:hypothetical protein